PRLVLRPADALHAEGALLHHALLAHGDVGVELPGERRGPRLPGSARLGEVVPVEVAHLVRAVIGAVAGADAAVVDLAVQPIGRVVGGEHRADRLAWRELTLLAQHRRHDAAHRGATLPAAPIALDPHPAHLAVAQHLLFADCCQIVLGVARRDARRAARALGQVD